jgi:proteasome lid subunit RPN8/RPN11
VTSIAGLRSLRFATSACRAVLEDAIRSELPREACGALLGRIDAGAAVIERVVPGANVHRFPLRAFELDPGAIVAAERTGRAEGLVLIGFFHAHSCGAAVLSAADRAGDWAGTASLVAAVQPSGSLALAAFRSTGGVVERLIGP